MRTAFTLAVAVGLAAAARSEDPVAVDKLPKAVVKAASKRFPTAKWTDGSKETDDKGKTVYELTAKPDGRNLDVTLTEDGKVVLFERELTATDLPKAVADGFAAKHPKAKFKIIESVTKVDGGKETIEYYEAIVETADDKLYEVEILPDGRFKGETEKKADEEKAEKPAVKAKDEDKDEKKGEGEKTAKTKKGEDDDDKDEKKGKKGEDDDKKAKSKKKADKDDDNDDKDEKKAKGKKGDE